jgi:hypothetical protein
MDQPPVPCGSFCAGTSLKAEGIFTSLSTSSFHTSFSLSQPFLRLMYVCTYMCARSVHFFLCAFHISLSLPTVSSRHVHTYVCLLSFSTASHVHTYICTRSVHFLLLRLYVNIVFPFIRLKTVHFVLTPHFFVHFTERFSFAIHSFAIFRHLLVLLYAAF